ncbi:MAG: TIGR03643 family protein [Lewinellaceae bacterium]|nr:TIGR03643 family protein [Lewinellaceae bacterium]
MSTRKTAEIRQVLSPADLDRVVEMAWEDRTPFDAIAVQFGLTEAEVIALMKSEMHLKNWKKWRARVQGRASKHVALRSDSVRRFRSKMQRIISGNRISKR